MAKVILGNADGPSGNPGPMRQISTPLPSRDFIISQQVQTLLGAANVFMAFIANSRFQQVNEPDSGPLDGGVKAATDVTLMNICDRLDSILKDESCWNREQLNRLENQLSELYASHQLALNEHRKAMAMTTAPQSRLSPQLLRMPDGVWIAFIGDPYAENSVVGMGRCVQDALDNFDKSVEGKGPSDFERNYLKEKNEQKAKADTLDGAGNPTTPGPLADPKPARTRRVPRSKSRLRKGKGKTARPPK